jgi:hypothetical protein
MTLGWLQLVAYVAVGTGLACALLLSWLLWRRPEKMAVMNWVWPLVALSGGPLVLALYRRHHRPGPKRFALSAAIATCHCGAGCTLGDLIAEGLMPAGTMGLAGMWALDTALAFLLGIVFQYFSIAPMRGLGLRAGLIAAVKADTLSLLAWQAGMIGMMAVVQFGLARLSADRILFWFAMQAAMLAGFAASYPVNWWLLKAGLKEKM